MTPPSEKRTANSESQGGWLVNVADDAVVPMTTLEVIDGLRTGKVSEQSLVWRIGMHDWTAVIDVPQLRLAAGSRPPPAVSHFTPVPSVALPLALEPAQSPLLSSLAPTTAEAEVAEPAPDHWTEIEELLSNERRADQKSSRRVVLGAALGAAALAAVFTLLLLRSPARDEAEPTAPAAQLGNAPEPIPAPAPEPAATLEPIAVPSAKEQKPATPQLVLPRQARRPKRAAPLSDAPLDAQSTGANPGTAASVAVVPMAPLDPAPAASISPEIAPTVSPPSSP